MTGQTALFLARLSHQWISVVLPLPIVFGVAARYVERLWARERPGASTRIRQFYVALRGVSYGLFIVSAAVCLVAFSHLGCAAMKAQSAQCMSNMKQLAVSALAYAQDYDECLPPSMRWVEAITPGVREAAKSNSSLQEAPFRCPATESPASYSMNIFLSGKSLSDLDAPANIVLLFEADAPILSFAGTAKDMAWKRHGGGPNVAFADGHTHWVNGFVEKDWSWTPTKKDASQRTEH